MTKADALPRCGDLVAVWSFRVIGLVDPSFFMLQIESLVAGVPRLAIWEVVRVLD